MKHWRTIFISDVHLGSRACDHDTLLSFLKENESDKLYLVGDILDLWALKRSIYWPTAHNTVVQKILRKARHGTEVIYIPGNHDEFIRHHFANLSFGDKSNGISILTEDIHITASGKKLKVVHGDEYDAVTKYAKWVSVLGSIGYDTLVAANRQFNRLRAALGINGKFSLSAFVKNKVKNAVKYISDYESGIVETLKDENLDGVVCGHIHHAALERIGGFIYANCGSQTIDGSSEAICEDHDGVLYLVHWKSGPEPVASI